MIRVVCSKETYVYNGYHMVKAFYPHEEAASCVEEKASHYISVYFEDGSAAAVAKEEVPGDEVVEAGELKYRIDCLLYKKLASRTGRSLAWGILMGVRPTKIAMAELEGGAVKEDFTARFVQDYFASREKAELAWQIAEREKRLLDRLDKRGISLYIGIPFCPSVCTYCSFSSGALADWKDRVEDYIDALLRELAAIARAAVKWRLNTIYIGGGTPTTLSAAQMERLLSFLDEKFSKEHLLEYTVEAGRPDSITPEKLSVLKAHGVTRISINPQSMQQKTLDVIGRLHTPEDIRTAYRMAREAGFDNINMDLIAGLPKETEEDMRDTLSQIERLAPDSITVHSLAVKRAARMGQKKEYPMSPQIGQMIRDAADCAKRMGMSPYYLYRQKNILGNFENVGYAKVDKAGLYNILIMEEKQTIVACGAGSISKRVYPDGRIERCENVKDIASFIERIDEMIERKRKLLED